jgi:hypothetical protein
MSSFTGVSSTIELSGTERYKRGLARAADEFTGIRERWATLTNEALREANVAARVSHLGRAAQAQHQVLQAAEPTRSTIGLDRLERIQQEARLNWLQLRRQEMTKSHGSGRDRETPLGVERDSAARAPDAEHETPDNDVSL